MDSERLSGGIYPIFRGNCDGPTLQRAVQVSHVLLMRSDVNWIGIHPRHPVPFASHIPIRAIPAWFSSTYATLDTHRSSLTPTVTHHWEALQCDRTNPALPCGLGRSKNFVTLFFAFPRTFPRLTSHSKYSLNNCPLDPSPYFYYLR